MTVKRFLLFLLCAHLVVLFLQLALRDLVVDATYWRDGFLLVAVLVWALAAIMAPRPFAVKGLDLAVVGLFVYGVLTTAVSIANGTDVVQRVLDFRNFFLPLLLYFVARSVFQVPAHRDMFVNVSVVLFALFLATSLFEYVYSLTSLSSRWIPWYRYAFDHDPRFIGNSETAYIRPEDTPVLGLLGFPHYSAPALVALFALVEPSLGITLRQFRRPDGARPLSVLRRIPHGLYAVLFGLVVLVFGVRTHIVTALVVLFVLPSSRKSRKIMLYAGAAALIMVLAMPDQLNRVVERFTTGFINRDTDQTSFALILISFRDLLFVLSGSMRELLFGRGVVFDATGGQWEIKILYFTAAFGLLWLPLFGALVWSALRTIASARRRYHKTSFEYRVAQGCLGMTVVYLIDAGHYMRMMNWPNFDYWIISLALLASVIARRDHSSTARPSVPSGASPIADASLHLPSHSLTD